MVRTLLSKARSELLRAMVDDSTSDVDGSGLMAFSTRLAPKKLVFGKYLSVFPHVALADEDFVFPDGEKQKVRSGDKMLTMHINWPKREGQDMISYTLGVLRQVYTEDFVLLAKAFGAESL